MNDTKKKMGSKRVEILNNKTLKPENLKVNPPCLEPASRLCAHVWAYLYLDRATSSLLPP